MAEPGLSIFATLVGVDELFSIKKYVQKKRDLNMQI